jgi:hypothetical protein
LKIDKDERERERERENVSQTFHRI